MCAFWTLLELRRFESYDETLPAAATTEQANTLGILILGERTDRDIDSSTHLRMRNLKGRLLEC